MKSPSRVSFLALVIALVIGAVPALRAQSNPGGGDAPKRVRVKMDGFDLSQSSGKAPNQVGGGTRDLGEIALFAPQVGKAYSTQPTFYWSPGDDTEKRKFLLKSDGARTIFEKEITGDHFTYPSDAPALIPGHRYSWSVQSLTESPADAPGPVQFLIVSGADRAALEGLLKEPASSDPARKAQAFVDHRIWYDALATYTEGLEASPGRADLLRGRALLYDQLKVTQPLADRDLASIH